MVIARVSLDLSANGLIFSLDLKFSSQNVVFNQVDSEIQVTVAP